jgi:hypothetical protein
MAVEIDVTARSWAMTLTDQQVAHARQLLNHMPPGSTLAEAIRECPELWWDEFESNADVEIEIVDEEDDE